MRIFITVGTQLPFDRLLRTMDAWAAEHPECEVFGQTADGEYRPVHFPYEYFLPPQEVDAQFERADLIVAHAGMGSIITALTKRKQIVIIPRKAEFGEHRNDHQLATARNFMTKGIQVAMDENELISKLDNYAMGTLPEISEFADPTLIDTIRQFINKA